MGKVKIPYYVVRGGRGYWQPPAAARRMGFGCIACGPDGQDAWARAATMNAHWRAARDGDGCDGAPAPPNGSLAEAFARYRRTLEWSKKQPRTREDWERAWRRIGPVFGHRRPDEISMEQISLFREAVRTDVSEREAHRCVKIWRALWRVAAAMRYCRADEDPARAVRNTEPQSRQAVWSHREARALVKGAWRAGYRGLAAAMAVAWDSALSPVDVRSLTPACRARDAMGDVFTLARTKTGRAALATLTRPASRVLDAYLDGLGAQIAQTAPLFRNRAGRAYSKDGLGDDFRAVRALVFGPQERRTLADFRRSGATEALRGGATAEALGAKLANHYAGSRALQRTYTPIDLDTVRQADAARRKGRR